jgi:exonuclease SbcD
VPAGVFTGWDLVLLGHLHRPQRVGASGIHYAGSLMKYSFSEAAHVKGCALHTLAQDGWAVEQFALAPGRDLRIVRIGAGERLEDVAARDARRDDYVRIEYHGQPIPLERLREHYPNVLEPWRIVEPATAAAGGGATVQRVREQGLEELFADFLAHVRGGAPQVTAEHRAALREALGGLDAAAREAR